MAKYYVVTVGKVPGIYNTWSECQEQTKGYSGAKFKSFKSLSQAEEAFKHGWENPVKITKDKPLEFFTDYIEESLSVDASCLGNPGVMEYQGVWTKTKEVIVRSKIYPVGTNNLGEFLAIVHALQFCKSNCLSLPIYSDSKTAIAWVRNKAVKTNLPKNSETKELWSDIDSAIKWLSENTYENPILKWDTKTWGESKADFGRK